jgi:hypothetical protein
LLVDLAPSFFYVAFFLYVRKVVLKNQEIRCTFNNYAATLRTVFVPCWPYASCIMASQRPQNNEVIPYALGFAHVMHLNSAGPVKRFLIWLGPVISKQYSINVLGISSATLVMMKFEC